MISMNITPRTLIVNRFLIIISKNLSVSQIINYMACPSSIIFGFFDHKHFLKTKCGGLVMSLPAASMLFAVYCEFYGVPLKKYSSPQKVMDLRVSMS